MTSTPYYAVPTWQLPRASCSVTCCCRICRTWPDATVVGSVSKVEMATPMGLIYKVLFPSLSTFETPLTQGRSRLRENHTSGTVQRVPGNRHSYCDTPSQQTSLTTLYA